MKILSVSVAAYNAKKWIPQCLDSFIDSGVLSDVEILVTDDGSGDETPEITKEYAARYPDSIFYFEQENRGPGSTVRNGAAHAAGKYFRIVDCDDRVDPAAFAALVRRLKETDADMICCAFTKVDDKTGERRSVPIALPEGVSFGQTVPFARAAKGLTLGMHAAVYKTEIFRSVAPEILNGFYTDMQYFLFPIPLVKTVEFFEGEVYQYRVSLDGQSVSPLSMQKYVQQHRAMLRSVIALYEDYAASDGASPEVTAFLLHYAKALCGTQMGIYLSFPPTRKAKSTFYLFYNRLKDQHPVVFEQFKKFRTARVLRFRAAYGIVSRLHRRKIGVR